MADRAVQSFLDKLNGQSGPAARLRATPAAQFATAAAAVGAARGLAGLSRVSDEVLDQVIGGPRPRDLTGILMNCARAVAETPEAAAAVASSATIEAVAEQRTDLMGFVAASSSLQQLATFGLSAVAEGIEKDLRRFLDLCERVAADVNAAPALRMEAANALLMYQGQVEQLAALRDEAAAYTRAVAAEAEARLALRSDTATRLAQVNGLLEQVQGK